MFSSNHFVHFVFGDPAGQFYLKSALKLGFYRYLWYELKKKQYRTIYFIHGGDGLTVEVCDRRSLDAYQRAQRGLLAWLQEGGESFRGRRQFRVEQDDKLRRWLLRAMKGSDQAFVFQLDGFARLFSGAYRREELRQLITLGKQSRQNNILLLCAPTDVTGSQPYLLDSEGVFSVKTDAGDYLCNEVTAIVRMGKTPLYEEMKRRLGERMLCLNAFTREQLAGLLTYMMLEKPDRLESAEQLDALTDFLYCWSRDEALQQRTAHFLKYSPQLHCGKLYEQLRHESVWKPVCACVRQLRAEHPGGRTLCECLGIPVCADDAVRLVREDALAVRLRTVTLPDRFVREAPEEAEEFAAAAACVQTSWNRMEHPVIAARVERLLDSMVAALQQGDSETARRAIHALCFCVQELYGDGAALKRIDYHEEVVRFSRSLFQQRELVLQEQGTSLCDRVLLPSVAKLDRVVRAAEDALRVQDLQDTMQDIDLNTMEECIREMNETAQAVQEQLQTQELPAPETAHPQTRGQETGEDVSHAIDDEKGVELLWQMASRL